MKMAPTHSKSAVPSMLTVAPIGRVNAATRLETPAFFSTALSVTGRVAPDELVEKVSQLPPRLRDHPWLGEFYGSVTQTVRQIYASTFGWFAITPTLRPSSRATPITTFIAHSGNTS